MTGQVPFAELVRRVRQRDEDASGALFRDCWPLALGWARHCVRHGDAEDVAQEAVWELIQGLRRYLVPHSEALQALLKKMVCNLALKATRCMCAAKRDVRRLAPRRVDELRLTIQQDPAQLVAEEEWQAKMGQVIAGLDPMDRAMVRALIAGQTLAHIAAALGLTDAQGQRWRRRLMEMLGAAGLADAAAPGGPLARNRAETG